MNVLVTGGAGFVGANLVRHLLDNGHNPTILDNFKTGRRENLDGLGLEIIEGDILDPNTVAQPIRDTDAVVHLAAHTGVIQSKERPAEDMRVNVMGTLTLLQTARDNGVRRFIFASSNAPLGSQEPPFHEKLVPHPLSPYGASKLAGEGYCHAFYGSYGLDTVVLRFTNAYGPYSSHKTSVVAQFIRSLLEGNRLTIYGDGCQTRDFVYIDDLCQAVQLALEMNGIGGELVQLGGGVETSVNALSEMLLELSGDAGQTVRYAPARSGEIQRNYSDISHAHSILGYDPQVSLADGLERTWEWFKNQNRWKCQREE